MKKYCTNLLYFIFLFHHEGGQAGKILSLWEKVCLPTQNVVNLLCNLSTTYFMEDMERASFQNFIRTCILCLEGFSPTILCWPEGDNSSFLLLLMMKLRSDTKHNLHSSVQIFFCIFWSSKCEKITPNVKKQNWNNFNSYFL